MYQAYLKRTFLVPGMAAFRQKVYRHVRAHYCGEKQLCSKCSTDLCVETWHAKLSEPKKLIWVCRRCRAELESHLPLKSTEERLKELGIKHPTQDEWIEGGPK
jgi:hypothetical protein